jgi:hypothetical protein
MKSLIAIVVICCLLSNDLYAQEKSGGSQRASAVYGEFLGSGLIFSAHYDFRFAKKQNGLGMRAGLGFFGGSDGGILTVPIGLNHLAGKGPHYFESGLGYTYATFTDSEDFLDGSGSLLVPSVGYRFQPLSNGFTARVYLSPLIALSEGGGWLFWGGFSLGYKF